MKSEEAKMEFCGEKGCGREAPLTIRVEEPGDLQFRIFCKRHFAVAVEFVRGLWREKGAGITSEATWDCCSESCRRKAVVTFRIRTGEEKPPMMSFCRNHLAAAFEIVAQINDQEAA